MKRLPLIFLCAALLCGCGAPEEETVPPTEPVPIVTEAPTEPLGLYDPESKLEALTSGVLKVYPLDREDTQSLIPFGDGLLLFSTEDTTTLTKLTGSTLAPTTTVTLDRLVYPEDPAIQVSEQGITYYDSDRQELVFLDTDLKEVSRISCPGDIFGTPALSKDWSTLYYFTESTLRALDLETGIDRLVKEVFFTNQAIVQLHCDDTVLECFGYDGSEQRSTCFFSTKTGETLYESTESLTLHTEGDRYFVTRMDGSFPEKLTGTEDGPISMLHCPDYGATAYPVLDLNGVVTVTEGYEVMTLDFYDLECGMRTYSVELPARYHPSDIVGDPGNHCIWLLCYDSFSGCDILCRWDYEKSTIADDSVYIGIRRTAENPDLDGLEQCAELAAEISESHGVEILTWTDATEVQPWAYTLVPEYQVALLRRHLTVLDDALSHFPKGFLAEAVSEMGDGTLRISLVRALYGNPDFSAMERASGTTFLDENSDPYICVHIEDNMVQVLYHELFHIIDSRVMSTSSAYDSWNKLNPEGFSYDLNYQTYLTRDDRSLLLDENRAFIDLYSMSYPTEDRARIFEYAMMPGNGDCFASETMQSKLRQLCTGIREAFALEESGEIFLWEQYLAQPLNK